MLKVIICLLYLLGVATLSCNGSGGDGKLAPYIQGSPPTVTANTTEECRDQCMSQSTFTCAAVNYKLSDRTCELLAENNQTASVVEPTDDNWQYYIRPICAGKPNIVYRHVY